MVNVLDKGYVILRTPGVTKQDIRDLKKDGFDTKRLQRHIFVSMTIKCPLFVKMTFPEFGLVTITGKHGETEIYHPTLSDVNASTPTISSEIADDIKATSEALMINPRAYRTDGCDRSVSQVNSPIGLYNNIIVSGFLEDWSKFISNNKLPTLIEDYREAIHSLIMAEYQEVLNGSFEEETNNSEEI